jgi:hypothetical protein
MIRKLADLVPELLEENDGSVTVPELPVSLTWQQLQHVGLKRG